MKPHLSNTDKNDMVSAKYAYRKYRKMKKKIRKKEKLELKKRNTNPRSRHHLHLSKCLFSPLPKYILINEKGLANSATRPSPSTKREQSFVCFFALKSFGVAWRLRFVDGIDRQFFLLFSASINIS